MEVLYERCCGLDVHKKTVTACVITSNGKELREFGTMTGDLLEMGDWLAGAGCTHVAMESTGVYWKPVYNLLEGLNMTVLVVNARHIKAVPGRKTDVKDAEWIADLLRHGLLRGSFVPDRDQRELRDIVRYRASVVKERVREVNRIQKVLEAANVKLGSVASDVMGKSGTNMIRAIVEGTEDVEVLSEMAKGRLRSKKEDLKKALQGLVSNHQRMLLREILRHIQYLDAAIERLSAEIQERMCSYEHALEALDEIPGVGRRIAEQVLAETGTDMNQFPSADHLSSWAGMCPGNNESAGKRKSGRTSQGNMNLKSTLVEASHGAAHTKDTYLSALYRRFLPRMGKKRALVAVGHCILVIIYCMLRYGTRYVDMGADYFDKRNEEHIVRKLTKRLNEFGYEVTPKAA